MVRVTPSVKGMLPSLHQTPCLRPGYADIVTGAGRRGNGQQVRNRLRQRRRRSAILAPMSSPSDPTLVWHHRRWETVMINYRGECLVYRRGDRASSSDRIALRCSGRDHAWTDTGRDDFAADAPPTIHIEITSGTKRHRLTTVCAYHRPTGPCAAPSTPG
jgi:hypothetical protein